MKSGRAAPMSDSDGPPPLGAGSGSDSDGPPPLVNSSSDEGAGVEHGGSAV